LREAAETTVVPANPAGLNVVGPAHQGEPLSDEAVAKFLEDGYVCLPGLLDDELNGVLSRRRWSRFIIRAPLYISMIIDSTQNKKGGHENDCAAYGLMARHAPR
jgi:hypothetical protein